MRRVSTLGVAALLLLGSGLTATVQATQDGLDVPTEIDVAPTNQVADGCSYATADWTVYVWGGNSGLYTIDVAYGDGFSPPALQTSQTVIDWSYTFSTGCIHHYWTQTWWASRSGGGTAYDYTHVTSN